MTQKTTIEIMVDTNANSRKLNGEYGKIREDAGFDRAIAEFGDYLSHARLRGMRYAVTQRDTAQIFHEKTNLMTPELAAQAGIDIKPEFLRQNLEQGHYHVEPPIHGEEDYYDALATFLKSILPEKAPEDTAKLEAMTPGNKGLVLQELYRAHMMPLPDKYRNGKYKEDFDQYHNVRFNAGELTAFNFLRDRPHPPQGERTAFVFVGSDREANAAMAKAREGKDDKGKLEVFVVPPAMFRQLMTQVIRDIEEKQPEMHKLRRRYDVLSKLDTGAEDKAAGEGYAIRLRDEAPEDKEPEQARAFSRFVTRLEQETRPTALGR